APKSQDWRYSHSSQAMESASAIWPEGVGRVATPAKWSSPSGRPRAYFFMRERSTSPTMERAKRLPSRIRGYMPRSLPMAMENAGPAEGGETSSLSLNCPHCGGSIEAAPSERPQVVNCPHCGQPFVLPAADGSTVAVARLPGQPEGTVIEDDLPDRSYKEDE